MVRGRTTAPSGLVLGHEITGVVEEVGNDVQFLKKGDIVSTPFNIACGRCANCVRGQTGICLTVNPARPGAAYGYVDSEEGGMERRKRPSRPLARLRTRAPPPSALQWVRPALRLAAPRPYIY